MELVAVDPHVEDVERAHRGPAVLVRERDRRQPVRLHLLGERDELGPRLRDRVALRLPEALPVVDRPGIVLVRHEVLVPVEARRGGLEGRRHLRRQRLPDVVDRRREALRREELHPVAGEPREDVVRAALQVGVDLLLEGAVGDGVGLDGDSRLGGELLRVREEGRNPRVLFVRPERDGAGELRQPRVGQGTASLGGRDAERRGQAAGAGGREQPAPRQVPSSELVGVELQGVVVRHEILLGLGRRDRRETAHDRTRTNTAQHWHVRGIRVKPLRREGTNPCACP